MTKELEIFLRDILESIELIEKRMNGITYDNFIGNIDLQNIVIIKI